MGGRKMRIVVVGLGYVGLSNAILLSQKNEVIGVDITPEKVDALNARKSPIHDNFLSNFLETEKLNISATTDLDDALPNANYLIISTPTDYNEDTQIFDTYTVESLIAKVAKDAPETTIVVKSTIPVGFIDRMREKFDTNNIFFSPEFLREGQALYDNLYPSRIIVGEDSENARLFADLLKNAAHKDDIDVLFTGAREAEAIKLFANTYLAMRVAYFNELDNYAMNHELNADQIVKGMSLDPRVGMHYNNPSFGYGGYCLPKDTKQLLANFESTPQKLITAIVESNTVRMDYIVCQILQKKPKVIGVYRLAMKAGSDNFRSSAIQGIMTGLSACGVEIIIYEPEVLLNNFENYNVVNNFTAFCERADIVIANRNTPELSTIQNKVYTRDLFGSD
jgi:UDPglucose 6-dehydrogenase